MSSAYEVDEACYSFGHLEGSVLKECYSSGTLCVLGSMLRRLASVQCILILIQHLRRIERVLFLNISIIYHGLD